MLSQGLVGVWTGRKSGWDTGHLFIYASARPLGKALFVTDVATSAVKFATSVAGTLSFLKTLGCLYDSFGIHRRGQAS